MPSLFGLQDYSSCSFLFLKFFSPDFHMSDSFSQISSHQNIFLRKTLSGFLKEPHPHNQPQITQSPCFLFILALSTIGTLFIYVYFYIIVWFSHFPKMESSMRWGKRLWTTLCPAHKTMAHRTCLVNTHQMNGWSSCSEQLFSITDMKAPSRRPGSWEQY